MNRNITDEQKLKTLSKRQILEIFFEAHRNRTIDRDYYLKQINCHTDDDDYQATKTDENTTIKSLPTSNKSRKPSQFFSKYVNKRSHQKSPRRSKDELAIKLRNRMRKLKEVVMKSQKAIANTAEKLQRLLQHQLP